MDDDTLNEALARKSYGLWRLACRHQGLRFAELSFRLNPEDHEAMRRWARRPESRLYFDFDGILFQDRLWGIEVHDDDTVPSGEIALRWEVRG